MAACLERARVANEVANCFVALGDDAVAAARLRDEQARRATRLPPLHGVPFAYKDVLARGGRTPTAGVRAVRLALRARDATALERLDESGAVSLGALNLDPFAYAATGLNPDFGDVRNPWDAARIAGGSSSGAAAAVAARVVPFAIGSDTGGSIRIPAGFCGVTGLKPTHGLIPKRGAFPLSYSQDTLGILARGAVDVAVVLESLAGHDPRDGSSLHRPREGFRGLAARVAGAGVAGVRIGLDRRRFAEEASRDTTTAAERALELLAGLGAETVEVDLSRLDAYDAAATVLTWAEAAAVHGPALAAGAAYPAVVRARLELALAPTGTDHVNALRLRGRALREMLAGPLAAADVLAVPAVPGPAPALADLRVPRSAAAATSAALRLNRPFSYLGLPALALPTGFDDAGLPTSLQLVGRPCAEATLLACGVAYQEATEWHRRLPRLAGGRRG